MFSTLRQNSQVYILYKGASPRVEIGTIESVSAPMPKFPIPQQPFGAPQDMVVDIAVRVLGQTYNYQKLPANADIADFGENTNIVVSASRDAMNAEVSSLRQKSCDIINSVDYHKGVIDCCDAILQTLNPEFAEKQTQQKEINELKSQIAELSKTMTELVSMNRELNEKMSNND